ncbi:MAG: ABC transporter ATP-binding protein [Chloroflexi bacterium]|nr:ABC transporter ATP-binding protein [Chloroflexota bacterium]
MNGAVQTENLVKFYGRHQALDGVSLAVAEGEVFGYLGPNGAGKTTTIRVLLDFIRPTGGTALVFGLDARRSSREIRRRVGYLPGDLVLYENLTGQELLTYAANLRGGVDWRFAQRLAERLECDLSKRIHSLSHGNKQKVGLLLAFMSRPELVILDEPTTGLDPLGQHEFYRLVQEVKAEGRTVFLSSHNLPEVERVCDRVAIVREGKLVAVESVTTLKAHLLRRLELQFAAPVPPDVFSGVAGVRDVTVENSRLRCTVMGSLDSLIKTAARFEVVNVISQEPTLEEVFLSYYGGGRGDAS